MMNNQHWEPQLGQKVLGMFNGVHCVDLDIELEDGLRLFGLLEPSHSRIQSDSWWC